jgi:hypothetical protein
MLLEKLGHLHTKTLNRLQAALLEHNFVVQYKKGTKMPADYLSRLPSVPISAIETPTIAAFALLRQSYNCCKDKIKIYRQFSSSSKIMSGRLPSQNKQSEIWKHWHQMFSLIRTN